MDVYVLQHLHEFPDGGDDVKLIGVYSSETAAKNAVARLRGAPGFCETPQSFHIGRYTLDQDHWTEGYVPVRDP